MTEEKNRSDLSIVYREINLLIPYALNARTHSDEQLEQLKASITEFGWTSPVLIDEAGVIIAGHGRVLAASALGLDMAPTITLTGLSETQKKAYRLADNRLPLNAGWDEALLAEELKQIMAEGFDLSVTGFSESELDAMLADPEAIPFDSDEDSGGIDIDYLSFCRKKIPMSESETAAMLHALDAYVEENGSLFGFVSHLVGGEHA